MEEEHIRNLMFAFNATGLQVGLQETELILEVIKRFQEKGVLYCIQDIFEIQDNIDKKYKK